MNDYKRGLSKDVFRNVLHTCINKVEGINDKDWQEIVEEYNLGIHRDVLRKAFQSPLGGYAVYKYLDEEKVDDPESEKIKEIEKKTREMEKMKFQYQDQKREYRSLVRLDSKLTHIKNTIVEEIHKVNKENPLKVEYIKKNGKNHAVILLSDWHLGLDIDNHWNKFNKEIAIKRVNDLLNKIIQYCRKDNVDTIHVELLGDLINGIIHVSCRIFNEEDVISQTMFASELISNFINELANKFNNIKVYSSTGNHSRVSPNVKDSIEVENFERLVPWYCETRVQADNVEFVKNEIDNNIVVYKFLNETIFSVHGNLDKPTSVVDNLTKMIKIFPTEIHLGHTHAHYEKEEYEIEVVINGTLSGTDEYAKSIRKTGRPMQKLMIYNEEGKLCTYKIKL